MCGCDSFLISLLQGTNYYVLIFSTEGRLSYYNFDNMPEHISKVLRQKGGSQGNTWMYPMLSEYNMLGTRGEKQNKPVFCSQLPDMMFEALISVFVEGKLMCAADVLVVGY